jgi:hypothetical protein
VAGGRRPARNSASSCSTAGTASSSDALVADAAAVLDLGDDVSVEGRSTSVPFVRRRQFAALPAITARRVDDELRGAYEQNG